MSRVSGRIAWLAFACLSAFVALACLSGPSVAQAEDTVWICKPGQADDLCAGTIDGQYLPAPGESAAPLGYSRPDKAPVDCFYLYPTQSEQPTPNSNLDKDPPIRRVVVQQARMFSSVCDVYAPMYRQVTYSGNQIAHNPDVETAYQSAKAAFEDFLLNHSKGRGFIMLGHSQGSAHTVRLIDELVDPDPALRKRLVGAIAPGANVHVPIGEKVGGMYENVPACSRQSELGCIVAYSMYNDVPGPNAMFSRLDFGYWIYPQARPDASKYEVMCVNPAVVDGGQGNLEPLVNMDYLTGVPPSETDAPWIGMLDYYEADCRRQDGAHWLNIGKVGLEGDTRPDLGALVASGSNYHVPEVNLAEGNLLGIARNQTEAYGERLAESRRLTRHLAALKGHRNSLRKKLARSKKRLGKKQRKARKFAGLARRASGTRQRVLRRKAGMASRKVKLERRQVKSLKRKVAARGRQIKKVKADLKALS